MKATDYLTALKVIREIQRIQVSRLGAADPWLSQTLHSIELYTPLDFTSTGGRRVKVDMLSAYSGKLFNND